MSAGADESDAPPPAPVEAASDSDAPPPRGPYGEIPTRAVMAPPGTSSEDLAALGADAALPDRNMRHARARGGPKGFLSKRGDRLRGRTTVAPPKPPGVLARPSTYEVNFHYANAKQTVYSEGAAATMLVATPYLDDGDYHSLAEISVHSPDGRNIIEVGWTVDRSVNTVAKDGKQVPSSDPHLFVYHWVDDKETCYNGCGWVPNPNATVKVGSVLPDGVAPSFAIQYSNEKWWVWYAKEWIGHFPAEIWDNKFTVTGQVQWFGEVASAKLYTCTDMGSGANADDYNNAGRITRMQLFNSKDAVDPVFAASGPRDPSLKPDEKMEPLYGIDPQSNISFRYGGPGVVFDKEGKRANGLPKKC